MFGGDVIYNLLVKKQYYYSSNSSDTTITDTLVNIGWGDGSGENGVDYQDLHASIRLIKIIEAIESRYDITFSRDFFGLTEFTNIFTWLNPSKDITAGGNEQIIDWTTTDSPYANTSTNRFTYPGGIFILLRFTVTAEAGYEDVDFTIRRYNETNSQEEAQREQSGTGEISWEEQSSFSIDTTYYYTVTSSREFKYTANLFTYDPPDTSNTDASINTIESNFIIKNNLPKVKIIDFLKGLFNMFKLVVIPQDDGTTYIDTLKNYYLKGGLIDVTKYIDYESWDVERGKMLNEINFLFKEPTTILNKQFEENTNIAYGDEETILKDLDGEVLDGTKLEFTLPFETILFERLNDINTADLSNIQYGAIVDDSLEPVNPKMTLFYNVAQKLYDNQLGYIDDFNTKTLLTGVINTASNSNIMENPNFALLFGAEFSPWNGALMSNTLYKNYHEDYILTIFNVKKKKL